MKSKFEIFAILINLSGFCIEAEKNHSALQAQKRLLSIFMGTRSLSAENSKRSIDCFDFYIPILNNITSEYEQKYKECSEQADQTKKDVDSKYMNAFSEPLISAASNACNAITACNCFTNAEPFFECYANGGLSNAKVMYGISSNASEALSELRNDFQVIEFHEEKCIQLAERSYVEQTSTAYEALQKCLDGSNPLVAIDLNIDQNNFTTSNQSLHRE